VLDRAPPSSARDLFLVLAEALCELSFDDQGLDGQV
jgi:hypothetical protein